MTAKNDFWKTTSDFPIMPCQHIGGGKLASHLHAEQGVVC